MTSRESLQRLQEGNRRFVSNQRTRQLFPDDDARKELLAGQAPFAIILGCSDSRVPSEIVFDQGLGDLFVIRIAGNVVAPSQIGSIEFAAEQFGTPLVVVLGHSQCGAVKATLEQLKQPSEKRSPNLESIVKRIAPAVEPLCKSKPDAEVSALLPEAIRCNVNNSMNQLLEGSSILTRLVEEGKLAIVKAEYSLLTGEVTFF